MHIFYQIIRIAKSLINYERIERKNHARKLVCHAGSFGIVKLVMFTRKKHAVWPKTDDCRAYKNIKIMNDPESFVDQKVLIEGEILDVCEMQGCWIEIASDTPGERFKVKVNDGEIVFPTSAKGKMARAEGNIYKIEFNEKDALAYFKHMAEEKASPSIHHL